MLEEDVDYGGRDQVPQRMVSIIIIILYTEY